jgi:hypothetical protein
LLSAALILVPLSALLGFVLGSDQESGQTARPPDTPVTQEEGPATADPAQDVTAVSVSLEDSSGVAKGVLTLVNHSGKRADYVIEVALQSVDRKTELAQTVAVISDVDSGATGEGAIAFPNAPLASLRGAVPVVKFVQRTVSP